MDKKFDIRNYEKQFIGFGISILITIGCFFAGWLLIIISPIIIFLIFKALKVWKTKERLVFGISAILIGILIFFLIFSYQMSDISSQTFSEGSINAVIKPYSTSDFDKNFTIEVVYKNATNSTLHYDVKDSFSNKTVSSGELVGKILNNETHYKFNLTLGRGIYSLKLSVEDHILYGEMIKEKPNDLFYYFIYFSGIYIMFILSALYGLFIFGIHIVRRGRDMMAMRYGKKV